MCQRISVTSPQQQFLSRRKVNNSSNNHLHINVFSTGENLEEATEKVCKEIMISRLLHDARVHSVRGSRLRLHPNNCKISIDDLLHTIRKSLGYTVETSVGAASGAPSYPAAMSQPELHEDKVSSQRRRAGEDYEPPLPDEAEKRNREIENLLVKISVNETNDKNQAGWAQLSWLKEMWVETDKGRMQAGEMWGYEKIQPFVELRRLVIPGTLMKFMQDRPHLFETAVGSFRALVWEVPPESVQPAAHVSSEQGSPAAHLRKGPGASGDHVSQPSRSSGTSLVVPPKSQTVQPAARETFEQDQTPGIVVGSKGYQAPEPHEVEV